MQALAFGRYGGIDELRWQELPVPRPPRGGVVVSVSRAALNPKDALFRKGRFRTLSGRRFPKRTGLDFAGTVAASETPRLAVGDRVFGFLDEWTFARGALAERVDARATEVAVLPASVPFEAGAAVALAGSTALQALRDLAGVRPGSRVLVHGASGGVGTLAIQIARALGATVVTTSSPRNHALCARLGASETLDYAEGPPRSKEGPVDVVFDVFGNLGASARGALGDRGVVVGTVPSLGRLLVHAATRFSRRPRKLVLVRPRPADLGQLARWLEDGTLEPVIAGRFAQERVHEAFEVLESKRTRGKLIVELGA